MSTREERCTSCDGTGDLVRADGEWIGYCVCEDGEALKAQQNFVHCTGHVDYLPEGDRRFAVVEPWRNLGDLIALHTEQLRDNEYAYFELAYTRRTGWMAWVCSHFHQDNPNREVIASGQADTPEGACAAAMREYRANHPNEDIDHG